MADPRYLCSYFFRNWYSYLKRWHVFTVGPASSSSCPCLSSLVRYPPWYFVAICWCCWWYLRRFWAPRAIPNSHLSSWWVYQYPCIFTESDRSKTGIGTSCYWICISGGLSSLNARAAYYSVKHCWSFSIIMKKSHRYKYAQIRLFLWMARMSPQSGGIDRR